MNSRTHLPSQRCLLLQGKKNCMFYSQKFNSVCLSGMIVDDFCFPIYDFQNFPRCLQWTCITFLIEKTVIEKRWSTWICILEPNSQSLDHDFFKYNWCSWIITFSWNESCQVTGEVIFMGGDGEASVLGVVCPRCGVSWRQRTAWSDLMQFFTCPWSTYFLF